MHFNGVRCGTCSHNKIKVQAAAREISDLKNDSSVLTVVMSVNCGCHRSTCKIRNTAMWNILSLDGWKLRKVYWDGRVFPFRLGSKLRQNLEVKLDFYPSGALSNGSRIPSIYFSRIWTPVFGSRGRICSKINKVDSKRLKTNIHNVWSIIKSFCLGKQ